MRCPLRTSSDWSALGYMVGRQVRNGVPCFFLHNESYATPDPDTLTQDPLSDSLKSLGAAMAAPVGAQHLERGLRQGDVAVLIALASDV